MENRIGEVIEASTTEITAQSYELYELPPLGCLVKTTGAIENYGIVYNAATTSIEPGRRPIARGKNESSEEAIYHSNPQLTKLLRSEFNVVIVGYKQSDKIYQYLPPQPPRIHSFVYQCEQEEVYEFSHSFSFLHILINAHLSISTEELIAAALRQMSLVQGDRYKFLVGAGKELSSLLCGQYQQLKAVLGRLQV